MPINLGLRYCITTYLFIGVRINYYFTFLDSRWRFSKYTVQLEKLKCVEGITLEVAEIPTLDLQYCCNGGRVD